jgi:hypothetical protein
MHAPRTRRLPATARVEPVPRRDRKVRPRLPDQKSAKVLRRTPCRHPAESLRYIGEQKTVAADVTLSLFTCDLCRTTVSRRRCDDLRIVRQGLGQRPAPGRDSR